MTDHQIAWTLQTATEVEESARQAWSTTTDLPDKDAAQAVLRHSIALRKSLERWIATRALRTQLSTR